MGIMVIAFSMVLRKTFDNIKTVWCKEMEEHKNKFKDTKIVLIGTKADLATVPRGVEAAADDPVTREMGEKLAREIQAVGYVETSAKTGQGVKEAVEMGLKAVSEKGASPKPCCSLL